jgi:GH24 family phage-related lysozyme (muramidase)
MNTSANVRPDIVLWAQMKEHYEGYRAHAYADTGGVWTVGFGSTYNHDRNRKVQRGDIVTRSQAERWMGIDQAEFIRQANQFIRVRLNSVQSTAICDYIYNRGIGNFLRTQLDELINANPNDHRIFNELLNTGIRDRLGNTLWGLGRRRRSQAWLYFTGQIRYDFPRWGALKLP